MKKLILTVLLVVMFIAIGCEKKSCWKCRITGGQELITTVICDATAEEIRLLEEEASYSFTYSTSARVSVSDTVNVALIDVTIDSTYYENVYVSHEYWKGHPEIHPYFSYYYIIKTIKTVSTPHTARVTMRCTEQ